MAISIRLKDVLRQKNMTAKELARSIGLSENAVNDISRQRIRLLSIDTLSRICKTLECQPGDILEYISDTEKPPSMMIPSPHNNTDR